MQLDSKELQEKQGNEVYQEVQERREPLVQQVVQVQVDLEVKQVQWGQ